MRILFVILLLLFSLKSIAEETIGLEHLMILVGTDTANPSMPNFQIFRSEDKQKNSKLLTFEEMIIARDSNELEIKSDIIIPMFKFNKDNLPHTETMYFENEALYVRRIAKNGDEVKNSKIATAGRWANFAALNQDKIYRDFRIYELIFERGIELTQFTGDKLFSGSEISLNIEAMLKDQEQQRKIDELRKNVFLNLSRKATKNEILKLKIKHPALYESIKELLDILKVQLIQNNYSDDAAKKLLKETEVHFYTLAKKVDSLFYKNGDDISKDRLDVLNEKSLNLYNQEHISERLNNLMALFFDTAYELDLARARKDTKQVDQLSIDILRLLGEVYLVAGTTNGSIGLEKIYSGMISLVSAIGFTMSAVFANSNEMKIALVATGIGFFMHMLKNLYEKNYMYKSSRLTYPGVRQLVQYKNSKNIRESVIDLAYEIGVRFNPKFINQNSEWSKYALENGIMDNEFMHKVARIIELASGRKVESAIEKFNEYYSCKQMF